MKKVWQWIYKIGLSSCVLLLANSWWGRGAEATSMRLAPLDALVGRSGMIALGRIGSRQSFWDKGRIYTRVKFTSYEVWKDHPAVSKSLAPLEVVTLGGTVGEIAQVVSGAAELPASGYSVLFLAANNLELSAAAKPAGNLPVLTVLNMTQGEFRVSFPTLQSKILIDLGILTPGATLLRPLSSVEQAQVNAQLNLTPLDLREGTKLYQEALVGRSLVGVHVIEGPETVIMPTKLPDLKKAVVEIMQKQTL